MLLLDWVAERPLTKSVRHLTVKAVWNEEEERGYYHNNSARQDERPRLQFLPGMGSHILYHKGHKISVSRERPDQAAGADTEQSRILASIQKKQSLTISTFGWDMRLLKAIVEVRPHKFHFLSRFLSLTFSLIPFVLTKLYSCDTQKPLSGCHGRIFQEEGWQDYHLYLSALR